MARVLGAGLAQLPAALAIAAVAVAAIGLLPGAEAAVGWTALGLTVVIGMFGPSLQLPHWLLDVSPFTHILRLPGGKVSAAPLAWLSLAALTLTVAGLAGLRHRDIG